MTVWTSRRQLLRGQGYRREIFAQMTSNRFSKGGRCREYGSCRLEVKSRLVIIGLVHVFYMLGTLERWSAGHVKAMHHLANGTAQEHP